MGRVTIKTLHDHHIESFMRCPYKFYYGWIHKKHVGQPTWRMTLQHVVNQVVKDYYSLAPDERTSFQVLAAIEKHWKRTINSTTFSSKRECYTVLAKVTDHLLQCLPVTDAHPPLFLFEKFTAYIDELQTDVCLTFQVGRWNRSGFQLQKFIVDDQEEMIYAYYHLATVFCQEAFGELPRKLEVTSLLSGKVYTFRPDTEDVPSALQYVRELTAVMQNSDSYHQTKQGIVCIGCPFQSRCKWVEENNKNDGCHTDSLTPGWGTQ
jgi:hypothetical protein